MMRTICLTASVLFALAGAAATVRSDNTFALATVASTSANTMIAVPWQGVGGADIRIDRLVSPTGLTVGDMVLAVTNGVTYAGWRLEEAAGGETGAKTWTPMASVQRADSGSNRMANHDGSGTVARGSGLWLVRRNPSASPAVGLYGIVPASSRAEVTVVGATAEGPTSTMLAHPDPTVAVNLNEIAWPTDGSIGAMDRLVVPDGTATPRNYMWNAKKNLWYYGRIEVVNGVPKNVYVTDLEPVPAGTGFWYVRSVTGNFKVVFSSESPVN